MEWLREEREKKDVTQQTLANAVGVTRQSISSYENGIAFPSRDVAKKIAAVLGFEWQRFYDDNGESASRKFNFKGE